MEKHKAIPKGYMTVGEIAKKIGITVRTLQYYDKEGVLSPSSESEGGRRLYTHRDIVCLYHIQSMKYLGFSLKEIKMRLPLISTPEEVASTLSEQAKIVREKINSLTDVLESIEKLNTEVLQIKTVDWVKYADIVMLLQTKNELYWMMKHFDGKILEHIRSFDKESADTLMNTQKQMYEKVEEFQKMGISPESKQAQAFAKDFWDMVTGFTKGDVSMLTELYKLATKREDNEWKSKQEFIGKALDFYLTSIGYSSFKEVVKA